MKNKTLFVVMVVLSMTGLKAKAQHHAGKKPSWESAPEKIVPRETMVLAIREQYEKDSILRAADEANYQATIAQLQDQKRYEVEKTKNDLQAQIRDLQDQVRETAQKARNRRYADSLRYEEAVSTVPRPKSKPKETPDLGLPLVNFLECPSDSTCTESLLDELLNMPDADLGSGDASSLKILMHFNEVVERLDARTTAHYLSALQAQVDFMPKDQYKERRGKFSYILSRLEKRKSDILSNQKIWSKYGDTKKDVQRIFGNENETVRYIFDKPNRHNGE